MLDGQGCLLPVRRLIPEDPHFRPAQQIVCFEEDLVEPEQPALKACLPTADGSAASGLCSAAPMAERDSVDSGQNVCRDSGLTGSCWRGEEGDLLCISLQVGCKAASSGSSSKVAKKKAVQARIGDASSRKVLRESEYVDVNQFAGNGEADERDSPGRRDDRGKKTVCFFKGKDAEASDCKDKYARVECSSAARNGSYGLDMCELSLGLPVATRECSTQNRIGDDCTEPERNQKNGHAMQRPRKRIATQFESVECRKVTGACAETCQDLSAGSAMVLFAEGELECASNADSEAHGASEQQPYLPGLDDELALRCLAYVPLSGLSGLSKLCRKHRDLVKSREIFQVRRMYGRVEHLVFVYSVPAGWTTYDASRNVWRSSPPANVNDNFRSSDKESLSAGTHVLWFGKDAFDFVCYRYDLLSNSWERGPSMVNPRCLFASASCGDVAYVAGGFGPDDGTHGLRLLDSAEIYNSLTGEWEQLPPMPTPRHRCAGVFMDGKFYVIGGRDGDHRPITSAEEYDPSTQLWRTIPNMYFTPTSGSGSSCDPPPPLVAVVNNQLYAVENSTNALKIYNKHDNTWSDLGYLPVSLYLLNGWGVAFKALGDRLFVMGDMDGIAVCCWQPGPAVTAPVWEILSHRRRGSGSFLYNCAVMNC